MGIRGWLRPDHYESVVPGFSASQVSQVVCSGIDHRRPYACSIRELEHGVLYTQYIARPDSGLECLPARGCGGFLVGYRADDRLSDLFGQKSKKGQPTYGTPPPLGDYYMCRGRLYSNYILYSACCVFDYYYCRCSVKRGALLITQRCADLTTAQSYSSSLFLLVPHILLPVCPPL